MSSSRYTCRKIIRALDMRRQLCHCLIIAWLSLILAIINVLLYRYCRRVTCVVILTMSFCSILSHDTAVESVSQHNVGLVLMITPSTHHPPSIYTTGLCVADVCDEANASRTVQRTSPAEGVRPQLNVLFCYRRKNCSAFWRIIFYTVQLF